MHDTGPLLLPTEDVTAAFAAELAPQLGAGDILLLEGQIGAGKSAFARVLIRALCGPETEVPSPTFTLVQTYESPAGLEIWHSDLYRLSSPDEIDELGLLTAFESGLSLVEWPDRLGDVRPAQALTLQFEALNAAHSVRASWTDPRWTALMEARFV